MVITKSELQTNVQVKAK